jgi:proline iminopeptidase
MVFNEKQASMTLQTEPVRELFPESIPNTEHFLPVSKRHTLYVTEYGNPKGLPAVFVHGGPGGGCDENDYRYFDPAFYRIILFDQRGCGKSTPSYELRNNTTQDLIADMEKIRQKLGIEKWLVFGGSWGSTLGLAYAENHPEKVSGLILRGIFLARPKELRWFYQDGLKGAGRFFPEAWQKFEDLIPPAERKDMIKAYFKRLTSSDESVRLKAAQTWTVYEGSLCKLRPNPELMAQSEAPHFALGMARIENHYFMHNAFLTNNQLLRNIHKIRHARIPTWIIQGRYDMVCPRDSADALHKAFPEAKYKIVDDAGHSRSEPGIREALIQATEEFKSV